MLTPQRWLVVIGAAFAFVAVAGTVMNLVGGKGAFGWVLVGFAAASALLAFTAYGSSRRRDEAPPPRG